MEKKVDIYITTNSIYNGILLGSKNISVYREELNKANKFPVQDNDTGDNLNYLMTKIRQNLTYENNIKTVLSKTSDLAIMNSRGNSGAIFSQFFVGFEVNSPKDEKMHLNDLVLCFQKAYEFAYHSINNPIVEGTILSAIKTWSDSLMNNVKKVTSFEHLYHICISELQSAVENTKNILKEQKNYHISDAGAMAFFYFVEGFMSSLVFHKEDVEKEELVLLKENHHDESDYNNITYRFCTEVLVEKNSLSFHRELVKNNGDSLVVSENKRYLKVHMHTNRPYELIDIIKDYGKIIEMKCDDMKVQSMSKRKGKIALLIDSIADLPENMYSKDTYMLPVNILVDNVSYKDKRTIHSDLLNNKKASSSQPSTVDMEKMISKLTIGYEKLIILTVSSKMSGIYQQYQKIVSKYQNIDLIDTKLNSVGEGLVVLKAVELINQNLEYHEIIDGIQDAISKSCIFVSLKTLSNMISSGRLNSKIGAILKYFNFLPIVSIDKEGKGIIYKGSFSEGKNKKVLLKMMEKNKEHIEKYSIVHCNSMDEAKELSILIEEKTGLKPAYISDISSVIKIFSGNGSIALGITFK